MNIWTADAGPVADPFTESKVPTPAASCWVSASVTPGKPVVPQADHALNDYFDNDEYGVPKKSSCTRRGRAAGTQVVRTPKRRRASVSDDTGAHRPAREAIGPEAFLAPEHKVVLSADVEEARAVGRKRLELYLNLANAVNNFKRLGFTDEDVAKPGSDRLVDAFVAHGTVGAIAAS